jgi:hypothetical protein
METIKLNGEEWDLDYVASMIFHAKGGLIYKKDKWKPRDALVTKDKNRATIYDGQKYDPNQFELVKGFWDHDHCEICNWTFKSADKTEDVEGYFNGYNWICSDCFEKVLSKKELMEKLKFHYDHRNDN